MTFAEQMQELRFLENLTTLNIMARAGTSMMRYEYMIKKRERGDIDDVT